MDHALNPDLELMTRIAIVGDKDKICQTLVKFILKTGAGQLTWFKINFGYVGNTTVSNGTLPAMSDGVLPPADAVIAGDSFVISWVG